MSAILVTGVAGFIGSWVAQALLDRGDQVLGVDNFNDYYDVRLKRDRAARLKGRFRLYEVDVADYGALERIFEENPVDKVCHLAAQAGVRYSLSHPFLYEKSNMLGTLNLLELCRQKGVKSFVYASSSSVYGGHSKPPFSEADRVDTPLSLYAATKKTNELMAYTYHHLFGLSCTGLRFFTVYGPWGRPDMAYFKFTKALLGGESLDVYNQGRMKRDFTYITDVIPAVLKALDKSLPWEILNLGRSQPVDLLYFIQCLEKELGLTAVKNFLPLQPGDILESCADIEKARRLLDYEPRIGIEQGIQEFVRWYKNYYRS